MLLFRLRLRLMLLFFFFYVSCNVTFDVDSVVVVAFDCVDAYTFAFDVAVSCAVHVAFVC